MSKLSFVSPYTPKALDSLKIAALYFDKLTLKVHRYYQVESVDPKHPFASGGVGVVRKVQEDLDRKFTSKIKPLIAEGIVEIDKSESKTSLNKKLQNRLHRIFDSNTGLLIEYSVTKYDKKGHPRLAKFRFIEEDMHHIQENTIAHLNREHL
jgi:hypothetical protein